MPMNGRTNMEYGEDSSMGQQQQITGGRNGSSVGSTPPNSPGGVSLDGKDMKPETVMEGWLLKRSRNNQWQDRYFVFECDQTLSYWHKQNKKDKEKIITAEEKDKASFKISRQTGCEIGDIYVEQRSTSSYPPSTGKESLYCIDISWTKDVNVNSPVDRHNHSFQGISEEFGSPTKTVVEDDHNHHYSLSNSNNWETLSVNSTNSARRSSKVGSFLRRRKNRRGKSNPEVLNGEDIFLQYTNNLPLHNESTHSSSNRSLSGASLTAPMNELEISANTLDDPLSLGRSKSLDNDVGFNKSSSYEDRETLEQEKLHNQFVSKQRKRRSVKAKRMVDATKVAVAAGAAVGVGVVTAGVGLAAGMLVLGGAAALGGTAGVAEAGLKRTLRTLKKKDSLTIATNNYALARLWKSKLDATLEQEFIKQSSWAQRFAANGGRTASALIPHDFITLKTLSEEEYQTSRARMNNHFDASSTKRNLFLRDENILEQSGTKWEPLDGGWGNGAQSLRIFKEEKIRDDELSMKVSEGDDSSVCTPLKTQLVLNAHPAEAFMCIMSYAQISPLYDRITPNSGQTASYRVLEKIDDHREVLHLVCRPLYLFPAWTVPRDFVVIRYWRYEPDGSYIICYESTDHAACPPQPGFVRGTMHQVYTIAPPKSTVYRTKEALTSECMLTAVVQVDPKGWVPTRQVVCQRSKQTYADAFGVSTLLQTLDIRDAIESDRFRDLSPDLIQYPFQPPSATLKAGGVLTNGEAEHAAYDPRLVNRERCDSFTSEKFPSIGNIPAPLGLERWAEPDPNSFLVRGPNYLEDGVKINAGSSIGQLIAMDCVTVDKPILTGMSVHPTERIQLALKREKEMKAKGLACDTPAFIFVVNIVVPATQCFHAVFYYAVDDMSTIDGSDGTPSSKLCQKFIFGDSDEFRDNTFKLIPRIVEGNFLVRKAVGSTPAIMGTRLKQYYVRTDRFMEIVLDCGSSQVAEGVLKLSLGYAKTLVVDMGFLLEAVEDEHLPERIMGCVRVKYPSFGNELRRVEVPPAPLTPCD